MNKIDLIKEAEDKLENERLENEKQKVLTEVRFIENRLKDKIEYVDNQAKKLEAAKAALEKEQAAADRYKETGDYEAYKKELDIKDYGCQYLAISSGGTDCGSFRNSNLMQFSSVGSWGIYNPSTSTNINFNG